MLQINMTLDIFGAVIIIILMVSCANDPMKNRQRNRYFIGMLISILCILLTDCLDWAANGNIAMRIPLYLSNTLNYSAGYLIVGFFIRYLTEFVEKKEKFRQIIRIFDFICMVSIFLTIVNLFTKIYFYIDRYGQYQRGKLYGISQLFPLAALAVCGVVIIWWSGMSRREKIVFVSYPLFPFIGIIVDFFVHGLSLTYTGAVLSVFIIYIQMDVMRGKQMAQQEAELAQARIKITLSQIQPHFLYNALGSITALCDEDPQVAKWATIEFASFLRGNMSSLTEEKLISFEQELAHTRHYLALEELRFADRMQVVYELECTNFRLPTLTLQPIVENAVRYGVTKRIDGGTVTISARETDREYMIEVKDDGVGFDPCKPQEDGRAHIGINNVRDRLARMCKGSLVVNSTKGVGTISVITIPKNK